MNNTLRNAHLSAAVLGRKRKGERVSYTIGVFPQTYFRSMHACDFLGDGKAQTATVARAPEQTMKALEHALALVRRDTGAVIAHGDAGRGGCAHFHRHASAFLAIADRVVEQVI